MLGLRKVAVILWLLVMLPVWAAHGDDASSAATPPPPDIDTEAAHKREALKEKVEIVVETNVMPLLSATNAVPPEKSFYWKFAWEGWNGLNLEIKKKTLLGQVGPGVTNTEDAVNLRWLLFRETLPTNALRLDLEEVKFTADIGARFDIDGSAYASGTGYPGLDNGFDLRRARFTAKGETILLVPFSYQLEIGYVPNQFSLQDTFIELHSASFLGDLKIGQFQPPMGLEAITGSRFDPYMEYAAPIQALAPGSDAGVQIGGPIVHDRMTWNFGLFADGVGQDVGDASSDFGRAILRVTGLPIYKFDPEKPDSKQLLHLGLSANFLYSGDDDVHYQSRPESYRAPYVVNTGDIQADGAVVVGGEIAWVNGPFCAQGEFLHSFVRQTLGTNDANLLNFDGAYGSVSWFLTGESRPYDTRKGTFSRVIPHHNFNLKKGGGLGALELCARLSYVDLDSANIQGGKMTELMTSLNWYLQPHVLLRFEYGLAHIYDSAVPGNINIFQTRLQFDF